MWHEDNTGFAVYKSDLTYHAGAVFGDTLIIRSSWEMDGKFKMVWQQDAYRKSDGKHLVSTQIIMVLLKNGKLIPVPVG
jgi:acyl-CoA thioesterase FadM